MATSEILTFAQGPGANVLTQAAYSADAQRAIGHQPGTARSQLANKQSLQSSLMASALAQYIASNQSNDVVDTASAADIATWLGNAVRSTSTPYADAGGTANAITADFAPNVSLTNGQTVLVRAATANTTTTPTFSPDGLTAKIIVKGSNSALAVGDIAGAGHWLEMQFDSVLDKWVLQNPANGIVTAQTYSIEGAFKKLALSASGTSNNVIVSADEIVLQDSLNKYTTVRSVSLTVAGTATGANGLDTGTLATSTWYSVWVIWNGTTTAGLLSTSATAPTLPSGYTYKARVGWIRTDGTANKYPLAFKQFGRRVQYVIGAGTNLTSLPLMVNGATGNPSTPSWSTVAVGAFVPTTAFRISLVGYVGGTDASTVMIAPNSNYGNWLSPTNTAPMVFNSSPSNYLGSAIEFTLESSNIYAATADIASITCIGWEDNL